jgi:hypothetical protein
MQMTIAEAREVVAATAHFIRTRGTNSAVCYLMSAACLDETVARKFVTRIEVYPESVVADLTKL